MSPHDMSRSPRFEDVRPVSEPVLWILVSLSREPQHGYALMKDVESLSEGRTRLTTGTLYGAIRRLITEELIAAVDGADSSRDRQTYRLTPTGRARLHSELERRAHVVRTAAVYLRRRRA